MTNRQATGTKQDADKTILSVPDAAQRLGVTPDAIRARLHRGTLPGEKQGGEWKVFLPAEPTPPIVDAPPVVSESPPVGRQDAKQDATGKQSAQTGARQDADSPPPAALIAAKDETIATQREEIAFLRGQLDHSRRELSAERERFDIIHREALGRIEALTATLVDAEPVADDDESPMTGPEKSAHTPESPQTREDAPGRADPPDVSNESREQAISARRSVFEDLWHWMRGR